MTKPKWRMKIAYDGTHYCGWQVQPNDPTVQETIQLVMAQILQETVHVTGSSRTDSGVHAFDQVAHFTTDKVFSEEKLFASLNRLLPPDIRILELKKADPNFHARYSAKGKIYHYRLTLGMKNPFRRLYSTHFPYALDLNLLQQAANLFVGKQDFTSFANEAHKGSASRGAVRTIKRIDVIEEEGGVRLEFEADGFLYKMVRNIVGTLMEVASGKRPLESIPLLIQAKDRKLAGIAAKPHGLTLIKVDYGESPESCGNEVPLFF